MGYSLKAVFVYSSESCNLHQPQAWLADATTGSRLFTGPEGACIIWRNDSTFAAIHMHASCSFSVHFSPAGSLWKNFDLPFGGTNKGYFQSQLRHLWRANYGTGFYQFLHLHLQNQQVPPQCLITPENAQPHLTLHQTDRQFLGRSWHTSIHSQVGLSLEGRNTRSVGDAGRRAQSFSLTAWW